MKSAKPSAQFLKFINNIDTDTYARSKPVLADDIVVILDQGRAEIEEQCGIGLLISVSELVSFYDVFPRFLLRYVNDINMQGSPYNF